MAAHTSYRSRMLRANTLKQGMPTLAAALLGIALGMPLASVHDVHAQSATVVRYGPDATRAQNAINATGSQINSDFCGVATDVMISQYDSVGVSQQQLANYLNSSSSVSQWGTPSKIGNEPPFQADIARDFGTDPRSLAAGLSHEMNTTYTTIIDRSGAGDATASLVRDLVQRSEPITAFVFHGQHSVVVYGVYATDNPVTDPGSVTALDVWDPGSGADGIQNPQIQQVPIATWMNDTRYWGAAYAANYANGTALDPDPAVGPYTNDPSQDLNGNTWIGSRAYIRRAEPGDASYGYGPDWVFNQTGALLVGAHHDTPNGYNGPMYQVPTYKQTFNELATDGPALWTAPTSESNVPAAALAWTGTDSNHSLNVMLSTNGTSFGQKVTLSESTFTRPAILVVPQPSGYKVAIAWVGTDPGHSLNIDWDVYGSRQKQTFSETSPYAPSITWYNNQIWLAWTGTDGNHSVNVAPLGANGLNEGQKKVFSAGASGAPALVDDGTTNKMALSWASSNGSWLNFAESADGQNWSTDSSALNLQSSPWAPSLVATPLVPSGMGPYAIAWTGTDSAHTLNLMNAATQTGWPSHATLLSDQADAAPSIGFVAGLGNRGSNILMAWTGTDASHHLNIALYGE